MAQNEIHKGDIGTTLKTTVKNASVVVDISAATTKNILLGKPDGTSLTKSGSFTTDGTDGDLEYATISGDLDQIGCWKLQAHIVTSSGEWKSDLSIFEVYKNI